MKMKDEEGKEEKASSKLLTHCYTSINSVYFHKNDVFFMKLPNYLRESKVLNQSATRNIFVENVGASLDLVEMVLLREQLEKSEELHLLSNQLTHIDELLLESDTDANSVLMAIAELEECSVTTQKSMLAYQHNILKLKNVFHELELLNKFQEAVEFAETLNFQGDTFACCKAVVASREMDRDCEKFKCLESYVSRLSDVEMLCKQRLKKTFVENCLEVERAEKTEVEELIIHLDMLDYLGQSLTEYSSTSCSYIKASISECVSRSSGTPDLLSLVSVVLMSYLERNQALHEIFANHDKEKTFARSLLSFNALVKSSVRQLLKSLIANKGFSLRGRDAPKAIRHSFDLIHLLESFNIDGTIELKTELQREILRKFGRISSEYSKSLEHVLSYEQWQQIEIPFLVQSIVDNERSVGLPTFVWEVEALLPNKVPNAILHLQQALKLKSSGKTIMLHNAAYKTIGSCVLMIFLLYRLKQIGFLQECISQRMISESAKALINIYESMTVDMLLSAKACIAPAKLKRITTRNLSLAAESLVIIHKYSNSLFKGLEQETEILLVRRQEIIEKLISLASNLLKFAFDSESFTYQVKRIISGYKSMNNTLLKVFTVETANTIFSNVFAVLETTMLEYFKRILLDRYQDFSLPGKRSELRSSINQLLSGIRMLPNQQSVSRGICSTLEFALNDCLFQLKNVSSKSSADTTMNDVVKDILNSIVLSIENENPNPS